MWGGGLPSWGGPKTPGNRLRLRTPRQALPARKTQQSILLSRRASFLRVRMAFAPPRRRPRGISSSFGRQYNARFPSEPAFTFATSAVGAGAPRQFFGKELAKAPMGLGSPSPGPVYFPPAQPDVKAPAFSFGISSSRDPPPRLTRSGRPGAAHMHILMPGSCDAHQPETHKRAASTPQFGKRRRPLVLQAAAPPHRMAPTRGTRYVDARKSHSSAFAFAKSRRFYDHGDGGNLSISNVPGPGAYRIQSAPSRPACAFSRAPRTQGAAIGSASDQRRSPGPLAYTPKKDAAIRSAAGYGFASARRFPREAWGEGPGPAAYAP